MSYGSALFTKTVERKNLPGEVTCGQKKHTSNPTKPALNSTCCWQGFRRSEKTHQKPEGLAVSDRTRAAKAQPEKTHMCRGYLLSDVHLAVAGYRVSAPQHGGNPRLGTTSYGATCSKQSNLWQCRNRLRSGCCTVWFCPRSS